MCTTDEREVVLEWNNGKSKLTILLDRKTNVATFQLAPGYTGYDAFCDVLEIQEECGLSTVFLGDKQSGTK